MAKGWRWRDCSVRQATRAARALADQASAQVSTAWVAFQEGRITEVMFVSIAAGVMARANARGVALADLAITVEASRQLRRLLPALGLAPTALQVDQGRLARSVRRVIDHVADAAENEAERAESRRVRVVRLASDEALLTVATTNKVAMERRDAKGWTRQTDGSPCPLCADWADGVVRPVGTTMARHKGCACAQSPTF